MAEKRGRRGSDDRGAVAVLSALLMVMLLVIVSFSTDLGGWYVQGQQQQATADAAALVGLQAYDESISDYVAGAGVTSYAELSPAQQETAEHQAMQDTVDAIVAQMTANGTTFASSTTIVPACCLPPPGFSTVVLTTDDGTTVTITRDPQNHMSVELSKKGDQYFSGVLRDAPTVIRTGTAAFSNCGATCSIPVELEPPFSGFAAAGSGDGFNPLIYGDEVWTINHHVRTPGEGEIVCMDMTTGAPCTPVGTFSLGELQTGARPVDFIDTAGGRLFFAARKPSKEDTGIACFDLVTRAFCVKDDGWKNLWDQKTTTDFPAVLNGNGPFAWTHPVDGLQLYMLNQEGKLKCIKAYDIFGSCGSKNTAAEGHAAMPDREDTPSIINGEVVGDKAYFTHIVPTGVMFHCWDFLEEAECLEWSTPSLVTTLTGTDEQMLTHLRYDAFTNQPNGICVTNLDLDNNACFDFNGNGPTSVPGLSTAVAILDNTWAGDTISWQGKRTFFAGGNSNKTGCWDWETGASCGTLTHDPGTHPYAYTLLAPDCILGLGHGSTYFSFDPVTLSPCSETTTETTINPCTCIDGAARWGEMEVPQELTAKIQTLTVTVAEPDGTLVVDGKDLLADPTIDLSGADPMASHLDATFEAESALNPDGSPKWNSPIEIDLELRVQPTLTG